MSFKGKTQRKNFIKFCMNTELEFRFTPNFPIFENRVRLYQAIRIKMNGSVLFLATETASKP